MHVINQLLAIEKEARKSFGKIAQSEDMQAKIDQGIAALEQESKARITMVKRKSQTETEMRLRHIQEEYQRKAEALEHAFAANKDIWLAQVVADVLHGAQFT